MPTFNDDWFTSSSYLFSKYLSVYAGSECKLLEIGVHEGRSTIWLAKNIATHEESKIDCIDVKLNSNFWPNVKEVGVEKKISFYQMWSHDALRKLPNDSYDFVYIDGSHAQTAVLEDAVLSFRLLKKGGIIAFDDYQWDDPQLNQGGTPKKAIDAFLDVYKRKLSILETGYQVWVRKITSR